MVLDDYSTNKEVILLDRRLGITHLSIFSLVLVYVIGIRVVLEGGYLATELSTGVVGVELEGRTYTSDGTNNQPADVTSLIKPQVESDAMFIPTRVVTTVQSLGTCSQPHLPCESDTDCKHEPPVFFGQCESKQCRQKGWCPAPLPPPST